MKASLTTIQTLHDKMEYIKTCETAILGHGKAYEIGILDNGKEYEIGITGTRKICETNMLGQRKIRNIMWYEAESKRICNLFY